LGEEGYGPVKQLPDGVVAEETQVAAVDVRRLEFLSSRGMALLPQFMMDLHDLMTCQMMAHGTARHHWQVRQLQNMGKLVPEM
jgi:hypothetical protein